MFREIKLKSAHHLKGISHLGAKEEGTAFPKGTGRLDEEEWLRASKLRVTTSKGNSRLRSRWQKKKKSCLIWWVDAADVSVGRAAPP